MISIKLSEKLGYLAFFWTVFLCATLPMGFVPGSGIHDLANLGSALLATNPVVTIALAAVGLASADNRRGPWPSVFAIMVVLQLVQCCFWILQYVRA